MKRLLLSICITGLWGCSSGGGRNLPYGQQCPPKERPLELNIQNRASNPPHLITLKTENITEEPTLQRPSGTYVFNGAHSPLYKHPW